MTKEEKGKLELEVKEHHSYLIKALGNCPEELLSRVNAVSLLASDILGEVEAEGEEDISTRALTIKDLCFLMEKTLNELMEFVAQPLKEIEKEYKKTQKEEKDKP